MSATKVFTTYPSLLSIYLRALGGFVKSKSVKTPKLPKISLTVTSLPADEAHVQKFQKVINDTATPAGYYPHSYLQCTTMSCAMSIAMDSPLNMLGSVHESCEVESLRRVKISEELTAKAELVEEYELSDKEDVIIKILITVDAVSNGETVQTIANRFRVLNPKRNTIAKKLNAPPKPETIDYRGSADWEELLVSDYPVNTGRVYAAVNGDVNPIHMHPLAAKLFGYKSCISHGMFSVCKTLTAFEDGEGMNFSATFKRPIILPQAGVTAFKNGKNDDYVVGYFGKSRTTGDEEFKECVVGILKNLERI